MKVLRADNLVPLYTITEPYAADVVASGSESSLKFTPSLAQKLLCDSAASTLTPKITAFVCEYFARSRWKSCASRVQPEVKSLG
jgi:hypothetical protein